MEATVDSHTSHAIRRDNLLGLIAMFGDGTITAFADRTGTNAAHLSQIKNGVRNMGNRLARKIEVALDKPKGWMDHPQFRQSEATLDQLEAAQIVGALKARPDELDAWLRHGRLLVESLAPKGAANPFGTVPRPAAADSRTTAGRKGRPVAKKGRQ